MSRQIVLDTETTGLDPAQGHRIIEIGCVELDNRRLTGKTYHCYINPEREIDAGAVAVHGITNEFLADKPVFAEIAKEFFEFARGAELVIHNAAFDMGFLNHELRLWDAGFSQLEEHCQVLDTLLLARKRHPGQKNNLDALCKRYGVDNSTRDLHGALLDAKILAEVYLHMTGGQVNLHLASETQAAEQVDTSIRRISSTRAPLPVLTASETELQLHHRVLASIDKASGSQCLWLQQATQE